ncbi:hypothetical protein A7957_14335 [Acinetobacter baumannii]|nr:hypothetical protein A7957_14335 [Acinetobacter baumannii]
MFVRSLLAMSLSCIIANVALAASTTEQPLNPNKVSAPVEDPIDPLAVDAASTVKAQAQTQITAQEQNDLNRASTTLQNFSVHDKFHRTLILSGFCLLKIAKISLNSSFFPKPIKR